MAEKTVIEISDSPVTRTIEELEEQAPNEISIDADVSVLLYDLRLSSGIPRILHNNIRYKKYASVVRYLQKKAEDREERRQLESKALRKYVIDLVFFYIKKRIVVSIFHEQRKSYI
jgi:hypothetical protein